MDCQGPFAPDEHRERALMHNIHMEHVKSIETKAIQIAMINKF